MATISKSMEAKRKGKRIFLDGVIARIKEAKGIRTIKGVEEVLRLPYNSLYMARLRGSIPYRELVWFAVREDISIIWLMRGVGPMKPYIQRRAENNDLQENQRGY